MSNAVLVASEPIAQLAVTPQPAVAVIVAEQPVAQLVIQDPSAAPQVLVAAKPTASLQVQPQEAAVLVVEKPKATLIVGSEALAILAAAGTDDVLSKGEKKTIVPIINGLVDEAPDFIARAAAVGVSSTAYADAHTDLVDYLATLTTPKAWDDHTGKTFVDGAHLTDLLSTLYQERAELQVALNEDAAGRADWTGIPDPIPVEKMQPSAVLDTIAKAFATVTQYYAVDAVEDASSTGILVQNASVSFTASRPPIGVALASATAGNNVPVRTQGFIYNAAWAWTPGLPIFAKSTGELTQDATLAKSAPACQIAFAVGANSIFVQISQTYDWASSGNSADASYLGVAPLVTSQANRRIRRASKDSEGLALHDISHLNGATISTTGSTTLNLAAATGDYLIASGNGGTLTGAAGAAHPGGTGIMALSTGADLRGMMRIVRFTGTPWLIHSSDILLPGAADIQVAADDIAVFRNVAGPWRCIGYLRASGKAVAPPSAAEVSANLGYLAGLTAAAGKLPYFNSSGSMALEDFAIGTWTPTFSLASPGNSVMAYAAQAGQYVRIGKLVVLWFSLAVTPTIGAGSGLLNIGGLPFNAVDTVGYGFTASQSATITMPAGTTYLSYRIAPGLSTILIRGNGNATASVDLTTAHITSGAALAFVGVLIYRAA